MTNSAIAPFAAILPPVETDRPLQWPVNAENRAQVASIQRLVDIASVFKGNGGWSTVKNIVLIRPFMTQMATKAISPVTNALLTSWSVNQLFGGSKARVATLIPCLTLFLGLAFNEKMQENPALNLVLLLVASVVITALFEKFVVKGTHNAQGAVELFKSSKSALLKLSESYDYSYQEIQQMSLMLLFCAINNHLEQVMEPGRVFDTPPLITFMIMLSVMGAFLPLGMIMKDVANTGCEGAILASRGSLFLERFSNKGISTFLTHDLKLERAGRLEALPEQLRDAYLRWIDFGNKVKALQEKGINEPQVQEECLRFGDELAVINARALDSFKTWADNIRFSQVTEEELLDRKQVARGNVQTKLDEVNRNLFNFQNYPRAVAGLERLFEEALPIHQQTLRELFSTKQAFHNYQQLPRKIQSSVKTATQVAIAGGAAACVATAAVDISRSGLPMGLLNTASRIYSYWTKANQLKMQLDSFGGRVLDVKQKLVTAVIIKPTANMAANIFTSLALTKLAPLIIAQATQNLDPEWGVFLTQAAYFLGWCAFLDLICKISQVYSKPQKMRNQSINLETALSPITDLLASNSGNIASVTEELVAWTQSNKSPAKTRQEEARKQLHQLGVILRRTDLSTSLETRAKAMTDIFCSLASNTQIISFKKADEFRGQGHKLAEEFQPFDQIITAWTTKELSSVSKLAQTARSTIGVAGKVFGPQRGMGYVVLGSYAAEGLATIASCTRMICGGSSKGAEVATAQNSSTSPATHEDESLEQPQTALVLRAHEPLLQTPIVHTSIMSFVNQAIVAAWLKTNQTITLSQRERLLGLLNREYFFKN